MFFFFFSSVLIFNAEINLFGDYFQFPGLSDNWSRISVFYCSNMLTVWAI